MIVEPIDHPGREVGDFADAFVIDLVGDVGGAVIIRMEAAEEKHDGDALLGEGHVIARPHAAAADAFELQRRIEISLREDESKSLAVP